MELVKNPPSLEHPENKKEENFLSTKNSNETTHISDTPSPVLCHETTTGSGQGIQNSSFASEHMPLTSTPEYVTDVPIKHCSQSPINAMPGNIP